MIKRVVLSFIFLLFLTQASQAEIVWSCKSEPYPVMNAAGSFLTTVTGVNFAAHKTVEGVIRHNLKKDTGYNFDVDMKLFSVADLNNGKFKSLNFKAPELNLGGLYVRDFQANTACDYNQIIFTKDEPPKIYEDFIVNFKSTLNNDDLQKTLQSDQFQKYVKNVKIKVIGFQILSIENPKIEIANNKIRYSFRMMTPLMLSQLSQDVVCDLDLKVENGDIKFANATLQGKTSVPLDLILPIVNKINPFKIKLDNVTNVPSFIQVQNVAIIDNKINVSGLFIAPKNNVFVTK